MKQILLGVGCSSSAMEVAHAYDKASAKDKNTVRSALDLPPESVAKKPKLRPMQSHLEIAEELAQFDVEFLASNRILKSKNHD